MADTPLITANDQPANEPKTITQPLNEKLISILFCWDILLLLFSVSLLYHFWPSIKAAPVNIEGFKSLIKNEINSSLIADSTIKAVDSLKSHIVVIIDSSKINISADVTQFEAKQLFIIAFLCGVLGASVHALTSLMNFVGSRSFVESWKYWYIGLPFVGGGVAFILFFTIEAHFMPGATNSAANTVYWVAALSLLSGMFTNKATTKFGDILDAIFTPKSEKVDPLSGKGATQKQKKTTDQTTEITPVG